MPAFDCNLQAGGYGYFPPASEGTRRQKPSSAFAAPPTALASLSEDDATTPWP